MITSANRGIFASGIPYTLFVCLFVCLCHLCFHFVNSLSIYKENRETSKQRKNERMKENLDSGKQPKVFPSSQCVKYGVKLRTIACGGFYVCVVCLLRLFNERIACTLTLRVHLPIKWRTSCCALRILFCWRYAVPEVGMISPVNLLKNNQKGENQNQNQNQNQKNQKSWS